VSTKEASRLTGLSQLALKTGADARLYPHIRIGRAQKKILFDIDALQECIRKQLAESTKPDPKSYITAKDLN
jgi:hypothetical protein